MPPKRQNIGRYTNSARRNRVSVQRRNEGEEASRQRIVPNAESSSQQHQSQSNATRVRIRKLRKYFLNADRNEL